MDEGEGEESLSRRQKTALRRAYQGSDDEEDSEGSGRDLLTSSVSLSDLCVSSDVSTLQISGKSVASRDSKRLRIETGTVSAQPLQALSYSQDASSPGPSRLSSWLQHQSEAKHTSTEHQVIRSLRIDSPALSGSSMLTGPLHELQLSGSSSYIQSDEALPDDEEYFDAIDHFGPDYFCDFDSDNEEDCRSVDPKNYLDFKSLALEADSRTEDAPFLQSKMKDKKDAPLYTGAPISQWESLTSVLSFVQSEHLSGAGLGRLLSLINLHLPKPNNFLKTPTTLFNVLDGLNEPFHVHYYCSACYNLRKGPSDNCNCEALDENKCVIFFITLPLEPQFKKMFPRPGFLEALNYKDTRKKVNIANIEDIYDSEVYKEAQMKFVEACINLTLMWNTDGMQIFKSNSFSLWPFYFIINELPPYMRFLTENLLIGGLWGSVGKPHPNVYLLPIYRDLKALQHGFDVKCHGEEETRKVIVSVICGCCDAPARATFMNMKQHSGFYSCPFCLIKGEKPGDATVFPYEEEQSLKNIPQYEEHVKWAEDNKVILAKSIRNEENCCGIKGPTILKNIVPNIFSSMGIDSMHCLYLGVIRQMLHVWCDKDNKDQPWSIFSRLNTVNCRIRKVTPPHYLQRTPQTLDKLIYWKATELRSFLFNLSLIVLNNILLPEFYNHWALLVKALSLLNSSSISEEDILLSSLLCNQFLSQFAKLYGVDNMTQNVHMLKHLAMCVRLLGPLWCISCFKFKDINGRLSNFIHGTSHVGLQIQSNLSIITQLPLMIDGLPNDNVKDYCLNIRRRYRLDINEQISSHVYRVGLLENVRNEYAWAKELACSALLDPEADVKLFSRLFKNGVLYVAKSYHRGNRKSSFVKYKKNTQMLFGQVQCFLQFNDTHVAIAKPKKMMNFVIQGIELSHIQQHTCTPGCNATLND